MASLGISQDEANRLDAKLALLAERRVRIPGVRRKPQGNLWLRSQAERRMRFEISKGGRR